MTEYGKQLSVTETAIPGLIVFDLPVHGDARGWFKENWQREKMTALGLSDFGPVQNNISFNDAVGTTRASTSTSGPMPASPAWPSTMKRPDSCSIRARTVDFLSPATMI